MKNRFNAKNNKALLCRFHVQTAGSSLQAQQIDNNIVRTTIQGLAVLGGTQSFCILIQKMRHYHSQLKKLN